MSKTFILKFGVCLGFFWGGGGEAHRSHLLKQQRGKILVHVDFGATLNPEARTVMLFWHFVSLLVYI